MDRERRQTLAGLVGLASVVASGCHGRRAPASATGAPAPPRSAGPTEVPPSDGAPPAARPLPLVVRARRAGVLRPEDGAVNDAVLEPMLGAAVARACQADSPVAAFQRLFRPSDVVGIKVGTLPGRGLSPHPELVRRLARWLVGAGVAPKNIVIWDRTDDDLRRAGFELSRDGSAVRCFGTNQDYDWTPREWGAGGSCFARILVEELTALINVSVLKEHDLAGISASMKNWYGAIHNPNRYHEGGGDPFVAHLAAYPLIRDKLRLNVVDGLVAQCQGGPAFSPRWAWPWGGVLVSADPVALDRVVWQLVEERRRELGLPTLAAESRAPRWIATAARLGLGEDRPERMEVVDT